MEDFAGAAREAVDAMGIIDDITLVVEPDDPQLRTTATSSTGSSAEITLELVAADRRQQRSARLIARIVYAHPVHVSPAGPTRYDIYGSGCFEGDAIAKSALARAHIAVATDHLDPPHGYDIASATGWNRLPTGRLQVHKRRTTAG